MRSVLPDFLKKRVPAGSTAGVRSLLGEMSLHTVCQEAHCPNLCECFAGGTAAFMILGRDCTRACRYCAVSHGSPEPPDPSEPRRISEAVARLGLSHAVVTSVTRDDLPDGGAGHFAAVIKTIRAESVALVEVLVPDFRGDGSAVDAVLAAGPDVFNHNVETVPRLYASVRPQADFERSLGVLRRAAGRGGPAVKSGFMVGLGETFEEACELIRRLAGSGVSMLTVGQYLAPTGSHAPVQRYVAPDEYARYEETARSCGVAAVAAGPFVRSSYRAGEVYAARAARPALLPAGIGGE